MTGTPLISVIAPSYHDWPRARMLVAALLAQSVTDFEILLVNNAPDDPPPADFPQDPRLQILTEARPGSYAARNRGAASARGRFLAFTDSDCLPNPDWLAAFLHCAESHDGLISGAVQMFSTAHDMTDLNWAESYDFFFGINQDIYVRDGVAATASLFMPRALFEDTRGFDASLKSGGDVEFCKRAARQYSGPGPALVYCPQAILRHPLRSDLAALLIKARRVAGGRAARDGWRALPITLAPPVVRFRILLKKQSPGGTAKLKAAALILRIKALEISETLAVLVLRRAPMR
ncbi:glycosyltransferase [Roseibaca sp. V10]|uniref:Glycosyltransferase n=1 Tax=Roseinatronobacter domitianus TaxID=2940293 RepID=A0ABT0M2T8_9RHOB|nr:glycosyltransferase family 2 protein [Roseibaca domitiana]MCL1629154.1 glycosyltransferase [Roseibaca domitiana]